MNRTPLKIPISVAIFLLLLTLSPARSEQFPTIRNHYVILIDGSGSNVRGQARRTAFYTMLRDSVATALFQSGFGSEIPPYDGQKDLRWGKNFIPATFPGHSAVHGANEVR